MSNREIKFRAWDYTQNKIRKVEALLLVCDGSWSVSYNDENYIDSDNIELMQYTGLKDKKGVEIFEGDIIKNWDDIVGAIEWSSQFICWLMMAYGEKYFIQQIDEKRIEVIGNIYENSELLEVKDA